MIGKGNPHNSGVDLAAYLVEDDLDHTAELVEMRGFGAVTDIRQAFHAQHVIAKNATRGDAPFFHLQVCPAAEDKDKVSRKDLVEMGHRYLAGLGLEMQPYAMSFHIDRITGEMHGHIGVSLVKQTEDGKFYIQKLGLYKNKLKRISRQIEKDYGLRIVSNERKPGNRARAPKRKEHEESNRLKTDVNAIRNTILDCYEKADCGKAFNAAMTAQGWILSNGTKRDCFVVLDHEGGHHALNKALTGKTLAQTEKRFGDLDRTQLPSVDQAKAIQRDRQSEQQQTKERAADKKPLGQTASKIREAAASPDFARGLKERGLIFAYVTPEEAKASQRGKALAKAAGRQNRALKEGFVVVDERSNVYRVDQRTTGGHWPGAQAQLAATDRSQLPSVAEARAQMKELNRKALEKKGTERKTVHSLEAQEAALMSQLAQLHRAFDAESRRTTEPAAVNFDRDSANAEWTERVEKAAIQNQIEKEKAARQEAARAAFIEKKEAERNAARPATAIEVKILEAHMSANGDRQKFAAALAKEGLGLARTTDADVAALDALRKDEQLKAAINADPKSKEATVDHLGILHRPDAVKPDYIKYFPEIEAGELAAVDRYGGVHRLNPHHLKDIAQQLDAPKPDSVARSDAPAWTPLPSIVDLRAGFESQRELKDKFFEAIKEGSKRDRQDYVTEQITRTEERASNREIRGVMGKLERAAVQPIAKGGNAIDKGLQFIGRGLSALLKIKPLDIVHLFDFAPPPPPTKQQAHDKAQARGNLETRDAQDYADKVEAKEVEHGERMDAQKKAEQEIDIRLAATLGIPATREATLGRDQYDRQRERERERDA